MATLSTFAKFVRSALQGNAEFNRMQEKTYVQVALSSRFGGN